MKRLILPAGAVPLMTRMIPNITRLRQCAASRRIRSPRSINVVRKIAGIWRAVFVDKLRPEGDEPFVVKYTQDCFYRTEWNLSWSDLNLQPGGARTL